MAFGVSRVTCADPFTRFHVILYLRLWGRDKITTNMNTNKQDKLATDLGSRALSVKTSEKRTPKPRKVVSADMIVQMVNAFFDDFIEVFKDTMNPHGIEIGKVDILWRPIDGDALPKTLMGPRLVPAVKVEAAKSTGEVPSWLEGNLC